MERLLKACHLSATFEYCCSPYLTTFTNEQVSILKREPLAFPFFDIHFRKVVEVNAIPLNVDVAEIRHKRMPYNPPFIQHLAEFN